MTPSARSSPRTICTAPGRRPNTSSCPMPAILRANPVSPASSSRRRIVFAPGWRADRGNGGISMAVIERVEIVLVDLKPKVRRTDAIQSFVSQETPIVRIFDRDGAVGTGYSYTIGTGGSSVIALLRDHLAPRLIGRDAEHIEAIWRDLLFHTHATTVGAITALALAAIDSALWDLRCRRAKLPLHVAAGGAKDSCPLYTTEGGWLHIEPQALADDALAAKPQGFGGAQIKVGRA